MKTPLIFLFLIPGILGAQITVCKSGCTYSTAQDALNGSNDGDTIVFQSGQNFGSLTIPGNRHNLTFKSSQIDSYPRGYRITRGHPALATLTTVSIGDSALWAVSSGQGTTLSNEPGGAPQPHGLRVGDPVVVGGPSYGAYACASVNQPPYVDGACDASRVGYINIRADTGFSSGMAITFTGRTLPSPLQTNTLYYIVNFVRGGSATNADRFQIAATPGGIPIKIPQFNPVGQDFVIGLPPSPQGIGTSSYYVVGTPTPSTFLLSPTPSGSPVAFTQQAKGYNGGGFSVGFTVLKISPVHDITFDGIEVLPASDFGVYFPFYVSGAIGNDAGEHSNIRLLRCWVHGHDDQETFPMTTVNIAARSIEVGWSIIEDAYSTANDTQGIEFMSTGDVYIHDNEIKGNTEGIMSGGNLPWFSFRRNTTGIRVERNYIWKPLKAFLGIMATNVIGGVVSPNQFQFAARNFNTGGDCSTVANNPNLGYRCFAYESSEYDPAADSVSRTEWTANLTSSTFTVAGPIGTASCGPYGNRGCGYIYVLGGVFRMDYNFTGAVTCPNGVICSYVPAPSFPPASTRVGIAVMNANGVFDGGFFEQNRNVWSKNLLESKYGDNWNIEGNVFHRQNNCDGGSTCQNPAIQFTVAVNGSGPSDPVNYMVSSSYSNIHNNIFRMTAAGIVGVGKSFPGNYGGTGLNWEVQGFGQSVQNSVVNNLFWDIGSSEYSVAGDGYIVLQQDTGQWTIDHNTAADVRNGFVVTSAISNGLFRSNIATPYRSACSLLNGCAYPAPTFDIGVQNDIGNGWVPEFGAGWYQTMASGLVDGNSAFLNNLFMNRPGQFYSTGVPSNYPVGTYLIQSTDTMPGGARPDPSLLFQAWNERDNSVPPNGLNYRTSNFRLAPGMASAFPSHDGKAIGADIDEIEAQTGKAGIDVEHGWPKFSDRVGRTIATDTTGAVISYLSNGSPCTIQVWSNPAYNGVPVVNMTDSGAGLVNGFTTLGFPGLQPSTNYFGKRWCGSEVDVFNFTTNLVPNSMPPKAYIDSLTDGAMVAGTVAVSGWAIDSSTAIGNVQVKVDGLVVGNAAYGSFRPDVCAAYPGFRGCPNVGFTFQLNTSSLGAGTHTITVVATNQNVIPGSATYSLSVRVIGLPPPKVFIDSMLPGATISSTVTVSGWAIDTTNPIASVQVQVDSAAFGIAAYGLPRPDVCAVYPGRPGCPNVGFTFQLDTSSLSAGTHTITVLASNGTPDRGQYSLTVTVVPLPPPLIYIDSLISGITVSGTITVSGWAIDSSTPIRSVQVQVDGALVGTATYGLVRPDVCAAYPGRPGCPNVGFSYQLDTGSLGAGNHIIKVIATDTDSSPDSGSFSLTVKT